MVSVYKIEETDEDEVVQIHIEIYRGRVQYYKRRINTKKKNEEHENRIIFVFFQFFIEI